MSINKIKQIAKKILNEDVDVINSSYDTNNFSKSLKQFTDDNPSLLEEYSQFGKRKDGKEFYPEIKKIEKGFYLLNKDLHVYDHPGFVLPNEIHTVRTGSPMRTKPFPMAREYIIKMLMGKYLYQYPNIGGHVIARAHFVNYLIKEGFKKDKTENYDGLGVENVVFSCSTTHAFNMILSTIMKDEDVVIVTGPNYGLFAVDPERMNGRVEVLDLEEEDNFYVNPIKLAQKIDTINERLKQDFKDKLNYTPRVVAFLNMNPHNPLGKVMNKKNVEILKGIGDVCLEKGVFVIDDLIYRDLTYDQEDLALPLATMPKYFNNTITLLGLSKAYGLAGIRAGAIVAPIPICKGIEEKIFSTMDSLPVLQVQALAGAFNGTNRRYKMARKYFKPIIAEYQYRLELLKALIDGIDIINNSKTKDRIIKEVTKYASSPQMKINLLKGIDGVKLRDKTMPQSGFFAVVDFTDLKGRTFGGQKITCEEDLVRYLYKTTKFKCIMGGNMSWPYEEEIIARFNYGIEIYDLIQEFEKLHQALDVAKI
jgi:aspartate/methionine/tyrosine aminotransferase